MNKVSVNKVIKCIEDSYFEVIKENITSKNKGYQNRKRSSKLIEYISFNLNKQKNDFFDCSDVEVLSKKSEYDRDLKHNEFLFDVHVCKKNSIIYENNVKIKYIERSLIQLESELNNKTIEEVVKDFEKLVCGNSPLKIMIISKFNNNNNVMNILSTIANNITESLYLVEIQHPSKWNSNDYENNYFEIYEYDKNKNEFSRELNI